MSRILGFARDILMGGFLGTVGVVEAFTVAFRFPGMFRRLVAKGTFAAAFVPLFSRRASPPSGPSSTTPQCC